MNFSVSQFLKKKNLAILIGVLVLVILGWALFIDKFNLLKTIIFIALLGLIFIIGLIFFIKEESESSIKSSSNIFDLELALFDSLDEGIVAYDNSFKIIFANKVFTEEVDLSREELIGLKVEQAMVKNERYKKLANIFFPFLEGEGIKILSKNPEIIEVKFNFPQEKYFQITYLNLEETLNFRLRIITNKTNYVIENNKRTEFFQFLSHSILTPLNEIKWLLESFNLKTLDNNNKETYSLLLDIVKNSIIFFELIISNLKLETSQLIPKITRVDVNKVIVTILDILKEQIKSKNLKVNVEISEKVDFVFADESLFLLTLYSLIENAVIYNKDQGEIKITFDKVSNESYIKIVIQDTGIGVSDEDKKNIFRKYYRGIKASEKKPKGFGIGLYMAKAIANIHGGDLKLDSKENEGTTVTVLWPIKTN